MSRLIPSDFGAVLRRHRKAAGWTQAELASEAGIGVRSLGDYERGAGRRLQKATVSRLADALKLSGAARQAFENEARARVGGDSPAVSIGGLPPVEMTSFVGRARELAAIESILRRDEVRLLTLTGPGGNGKSRLAIRLARALAPEFADGVFFASLAVVDDP